MAEQTLYAGGRVFTADPSRPWAEALLVEGEHLRYVGDTDAARREAGNAAEVDLDGALVLPGFVDGHAHVLQTGEALLRADLRSAADLAEIQRRLREWARANPAAPRVLGRSWLYSAVPGGVPTKQMLDDAVPDRPVHLNANDYHSVWVNSAALQEMGITATTPDPPGGEIARDPLTGEATGHLIETAADQIDWPFLAAATTDAERDGHLRAAIAAWNAAGTTSAVDMAMDRHALEAMVRADRAGALTLRVAGHWLIHRSGDTLEQIAEAAGHAAVHRSSLLQIVGVKFIVDGVIDGCTAALLDPYTNGRTAEPIWPADVLTPAVIAADAAGLQIALHAIGDRAIRIALDAIEQAISVNGRWPRRHRIEHLEYADPADIARLGELGVTASMQPVHSDPAIQDNWRALLGADRADRGFAWPEMTAAGATLAFGTDAPTAPHHPLPNMFIAATRRSALDPSLPPNLAHYALPLPEAIGHGTRDAAWSCGREHLVGRLAAGMLADFAVIDRDVLTADPEELLTASVTRTVFGGRPLGGTPG